MTDCLVDECRLLPPCAGEDDPSLTVPIRSVTVVRRGGRPVVQINGAPTIFACHYIRNHRHRMKERYTDGIRESVRECSRHGIHRFELQVGTGWTGLDGFDPMAIEHGEFRIEEAIAAVLAEAPAAQLVLRIGCFMTPNAWKEAFPDELERDDMGTAYDISFASDAGMAAMAQALYRIVEYAESRPYGSHIAGYNIFLEFEGIPWGGCSENAVTDFSPAMQRAWRDYLETQYGNDEALRHAWADGSVTLRSATVPTRAEHFGTDDRMLFPHPVAGRKLRDYYALMDELVVRRHRQMAAAVRAASGSRKLVGMMGGYSQDAGEPRWMASSTGSPRQTLHKHHLNGPGCWGRAFDIPEIDFYFAPTDYYYTDMGGPALILNMPASQHLHNKLCWMENDQRTHSHTSDLFTPRLRSEEESIAVEQRNFGLLYAEADCVDWMEQTENWLMHDGILANLGLEERLLRTAAAQPEQVIDAVCVLFDEESLGWSRPTTLLDEKLWYHQRNGGLAFCGAAVRHHLLSDLAHPDFPAYRCYILPNAWHWTPEKEALVARVRRDGNVLVWLYAPGYVTEDGYSTARMQMTVGMRLACAEHPWEHRISICDYMHPITRNLPEALVFGTDRHYGPIFRVDDPAATVLGRSFGFRMARHDALAIREFGRGARGHGDAAARGEGDYASIYCEAPDLPAPLLREMARYAGTHIYTESNDHIQTGRDMLMIHSIKPGAKRLRLPSACRVLNMLDGTHLADSTDCIEFTLERPGTRVFRILPI